MGMESFNNAPLKQEEKEQVNSEKYEKEAIAVAQRISQNWQKLKDMQLNNPQMIINSGGPKLQEIFDMTKPPQTGIQLWFESQVKFIEKAAGDEDAKSRMMFRLKEDLEDIEGKVNNIIE